MITIFYSWQSDLPAKFTRTLFRDVIQYAISEIERKDLEIKIDLQEATSNIPGSPEIPDTILQKINNTDIFIGDLSIINFEEKTTRKTPNPNVLFEVGYARAILGWDRIIMLFNEAYGDLNHLPFDLNKRRITKIDCNNTDAKKRTIKKFKKYFGTFYFHYYQ